MAPLDVAALYTQLLEADGAKPFPIAAIEALTEVIAASTSQTMSELLRELEDANHVLKAAAWNSISLSAGTALLMRFVALKLQSSSDDKSFDAYKQDVAREARAFVKASKMCAQKIVQEASTFIVDGACVLTHSYSRLVSQTLIHAATVSRKRFTVYVTEARPFGLGVKTHAVLTKAGIPCTVLLDSAAAYAMNSCDIVMLGAEGVLWNGGVVNAIGTLGLCLSAKHFGKPVYGRSFATQPACAELAAALAESFKFLRLFPLSQADLPTSRPILGFKDPDTDADFSNILKRKPPARVLSDSASPEPFEMTLEQVEQNPLLDYCPPELIQAICADVGILTPSAVADSLLAIFGGVE